MNHFHKDGRGLCLPDMTVETQCIASLQHQNNPQNFIGDIRRGVSHTPASHTPTCDDHMICTGGRKYSAPTWTVLILIFICCLFNNEALASRQYVGTAQGQQNQIVLTGVVRSAADGQALQGVTVSVEKGQERAGERVFALELVGAVSLFTISRSFLISCF